MLSILERIQESDEPRRLDCRQDIPLDQDVLHLVHLGQGGFTHLFQGTDFPCVDLSCEIDGSITTLTDLSNYGKLVDTELGSSFSQGGTFSTRVALVFFGEGRSCDLTDCQIIKRHHDSGGDDDIPVSGLYRS